MKLKYILAILVTFTMFSGNAQQDAQFSDYKINMSSFNPAFAGFFDGSILLLHRSQYTGFEGAPETQNLNVNIPLTMNMGAGFNVINEKAGVTQQLIVTGDYSYTIYTNDINMLTFGLKAGFNSLNVDYTRLDLGNSNDDSFRNNINNQITPRIGLGFLYNTQSWFIGVSSPNLIKEKFDPEVKEVTLSAKPQIYFTTGYQTALSDDLLFKPSILAKAASNVPFAIDFAFNFEYMQQFRFGVSYRLNSAVTAMVGINILQDFQVGYAYDYNTNDLGKYAQSSHQFYLKYIFKQAKNMRRDCGCSFTDPVNNIGF